MASELDDLATWTRIDADYIEGTAGKFALYGGMQVKSWDENTVDYRHYRARKDVGGLIYHPEQVRRIVDTSVTP